MNVDRMNAAMASELGALIAARDAAERRAARYEAALRTCREWAAALPTYVVEEIDTALAGEESAGNE